MSSKSIVCATLLLVFLCGVLSQETASKPINVESLTAYNKWRFQNKRVFLNEDESIFRQMIFIENYAKIFEFNLNPANTYKQAVNAFSDMTQEEFASKILNSAVSAPSAEHSDNEKLVNLQSVGVGAPLAVDWRSVGGVTPVKNQGQCGSCWSFSSSGVMESFNFKLTQQLKNFSEQQLVDCVNAANGYHSLGCQGGWPQEAISYATRFGILLSSQYPYVAVQGQCRVASPTTGYFPKTFGKVNNTANDLKNAIAFAPTSVLVDATTWGSYGSGVFNGCGAQIQLNHAVLAIGYDASGNWIIKNSWSPYWGEQGYMRLAPGNTCGILSDNWLVVS